MRETFFVRLWLFWGFALLAWTLCAPHGDLLAAENRPYAAFSVTAPDAYFTDRLPVRQSLLRMQRDLVLFLGKNEFSGAFLGKDGYIFSEEKTDVNILFKNIEALQTFDTALEIPLHTAIVGAKQDVLFHRLPPRYADTRNLLWQTLSEIPNIDLLTALRSQGANGKYIYYRSDHHLTSLGSFYVYQTLARPLGITPYTDFSVSVVQSDFSGSDARKMLSETKDTLALFRYRNDRKITVENMDTGTVRELYDHAKLHSSDPYGVFPIPDCGRARIRMGNCRTLLLLCDSYGDALVPFLARHFDLDIIDPRYYGGSVKTLVKENGYAAVLVYFGMDTIAGRELLYKINF